jgi:hypothetical protein
MANRRRLLVQVEKLLGSLLTEAQQTMPAILDADGVEKTPARPSVTFGERLRLAEVVAQYEVRRAKIEEDAEPSEMETILEEFHSNASRTPPSRAGRKARAPESDGIANGGRALGSYRNGIVEREPAPGGGADSPGF